MNQPDADRPWDSTFLVERYWPGVDEAQLRIDLQKLDEAALRMRAEGQLVQHLFTILMPTDQVVFTLIAAASEAAVRELNARVDMPIDRVARAIQLMPDRVLEVKR